MSSEPKIIRKEEIISASWHYLCVCLKGTRKATSERTLTALAAIPNKHITIQVQDVTGTLTCAVHKCRVVLTGCGNLQNKVSRVARLQLHAAQKQKILGGDRIVA